MQSQRSKPSMNKTQTKTSKLWEKKVIQTIKADQKEMGEVNQRQNQSKKRCEWLY